MHGYTWDTTGQTILSQMGRIRTRRSNAVRAGKLVSPIRVVVSGALLVADLVAIVISAVIAELTAFAINTWVLHQTYAGLSDAALDHRILVWFCLTVAVCGWFALRGTYTVRDSFQQDMKQSTSAFAVVLLFDGFVGYAEKSNFSRLWVVLLWATAAILVPIARVQVRKALSALGYWRVGAVILGQGEHSESVDHLLSQDAYTGYSAVFRTALNIEAHKPLPEIAAGIVRSMRQHGAEFVILVPDEAEVSKIDRILDALNSSLVPYVVVPPLQRIPFSGLSVQTLPNSDMVLLTPRLGLMSPLRRKAKRAFDIATSAFLLLLMAPLFAVLAAIIALDGGSPFYGHLRVGRGGQSFRCLKFRSMAKDADKILARVLAEDPERARQWATNFKLDDDPRITKIGKFLRTTSLDELPQLINVLRGEMSLVGPRPVVAKELEQFYGEDAFYYQLVRPGITGLWQVSGRSDVSYDKRVFLDAWYVRNWDHWTDLMILLNTLPSVLRREGAR